MAANLKPEYLQAAATLLANHPEILKTDFHNNFREQAESIANIVAGLAIALRDANEQIQHG